MSSIELLMRRAHELAGNGLGAVSPNPLVGCVIVKDDIIIGEGWHKAYGGPHAEVNAIASVADQGKLTGSTVIVNLEPCSHYGKTPPCADLLVSHHVGKVIISNRDTNPLVSGKGIARLREAGIEVIEGVLESEGRELNKRFFTMIEKKRPYVILKWAQTENGMIAGQEGDPRWISNAVSRQLVHRWRTEEDAVLVGYKTALIDNPRLNSREWIGRDPVRVVIDKQLALPRSLNVFDGTQRTVILNTVKNDEQKNTSFVKLNDDDFVLKALAHLFERNVQSLIIEGGAGTLKMFIESGLWDEARVFSSPISFKAGLPAPVIDAKIEESANLAGDTLTIHYNLTPMPAPFR
jgi:diaminohydroxyphosphoribosylaminopyrimidine deaminase / 5-amino-6-(5-phosphoribosylamino)uracil reductase